MTTAEERAKRWDEQAERNIGPVTAQLRSLYEQVDKERARHKELAAQVQALTTERDGARETNQRLNRRAQIAEAGVEDNLDACRRAGVSFGRTLSLAGYKLMEAERDTIKDQLETATGLLRERSQQYHVSQKHQSGVTIHIAWEDCQREPCASDATFLDTKGGG